MEGVSRKSNWFTPVYHRPAIGTAALVALGVGGVGYAAGLSLRSSILLTPSTGVLLYGAWRMLCQTPPPPSPTKEAPREVALSPQELEQRRDILTFFIHQQGGLRLSFLSKLLETMGEEKFRSLVSNRYPQKTIILPFLTDLLVEELGKRGAFTGDASAAEAREILRSGVYQEGIPYRHLIIAYLVGPGSTMKPALFEELYGFKVSQEEVAAATALFQRPAGVEEGWSEEATTTLAHYFAPKVQFEKEERLAAVAAFALVSIWAAACYWRESDPFFPNELHNYGVGFLLFILPVGFVQKCRKPVFEPAVRRQLITLLPEAPIVSFPTLSREERKPLNRAALIAFGRLYGERDSFGRDTLPFSVSRNEFSSWSPEGTISSSVARDLLLSKGWSAQFSQDQIPVTTFLNIEELLRPSPKWGLCSYLKREGSIERIQERLNLHGLKLPYPGQLEEAVRLIQEGVTPDSYSTLPTEFNGLNPDQVGQLKREWEMATELGREQLADRFSWLVFANWGLITEDPPLFTQDEVKSILDRSTAPRSTEDAQVVAQAVTWWPRGIDQEEWRGRIYNNLPSEVWSGALKLTPVALGPLFVMRRIWGRAILGPRMAPSRATT